MAVSSRHVVIVGGGIAGLTAAYAVHDRAATAGFPLRCTVIEAASEWGGKILTHKVGGFVMEAGPDSFLSQKPWAIDLCRQLGLSDQLINTNPLKEKAFVFSRGRLRPLPDGLVVIVPTNLGPFLRSGLLSWSGMARMALDLVLPAQPATDGDESLATFFRRRLGHEAFERLIEPLMAGIYAGDAQQMSLRATFPQFLDMERRYGSLIRGMLADRRSGPPKNSNGGGRTTFVTLRDGLQTLVHALVAQLEKVGTTLLSARRVAVLRRRSAQAGPPYDVLLENDSAIEADAVVLATPAYVAGALVNGFCPTAAKYLKAIPYASTATVSLAYDQATLGPRAKGFGFVVPRIEHRDVLAATWTSQKWGHRAPPSRSVVRCYVGGIGREEILQLSDETVIRRVRNELNEMAGITAVPMYTEVNRWARAMPQYTIGHLERLNQLHTALEPYHGLYLTGAGYRGIGLPDCIRDGTETAERVCRDLMRGIGKRHSGRG